MVFISMFTNFSKVEYSHLLGALYYFMVFIMLANDVFPSFSNIVFQ